MLWTGKDKENNWIGAVDGSLGPLHLHSSPQFLRSHPHSTVQKCRTPILATVYFTLKYRCLDSEPSSCSSLYQKLDFSVSFVKPCPWVSCSLCKHKHNDVLKSEENVQYQDWSVSWYLTQREDWSNQRRCSVMESILTIRSSLSQWMRFCC